MPIYAYKCSECNHEFEKLERMGAPIKRKCDKCKKIKAKRQVSGGVGFVFKGSGFYCTDYPKGN